MKFMVVGSLAVVFLLIQETVSLSCYEYVENSHAGFPDAWPTTSTECAATDTHCAAISWASKLTTTGEVVNFKQGLCTGPDLCHGFCSALYRDPTVGVQTTQCQQQCCNGDECNQPR